MSGVEQPEGREGQDRATEAGALPEGADIVERPAADPALGVGVPPFHPGGEPAGRLDLLVVTDEPEQLVLALKKIAGERKGDRRWEGIRRLCERAEEYFEVINRPEANRPHGSRIGVDLAAKP